MTRAEHLAWAKERALQLVAAGALPQAVSSFASDLTKHAETAPQAYPAAADLTQRLLNGAKAEEIRVIIEAFE